MMEMGFYLAGLLAMAAGAVIWPWVARRQAVAAGCLAALAPAAMFLWLVGHAGRVAAGDLPHWAVRWVPQLDVELAFRLNGLGLLLSMLISGIGALILIYGGGYLKGSPQAPAFFAFVQLFMLAMLGLACADHLMALFVFWELTSVASYFLIGLSHRDEAARKSALRALLVTGAGGLAMMAGILLLGGVAGTFSLAALQERGDLVRASTLYPAIFVLIAAGAFTKSAQVPFHFWLPDAMAAPTPVSAYLHSATMVKAGVFLLAQLLPVLGGTRLWHDTLTICGGMTMVTGAVLAMAQTDLKRILAYSTLSALGTLVMLLGFATPLALKAAMLFLVVHALYKAPLFMIAGIVDKAAGTRNVTLLQGLGRRLPLVAAVAALAAFSMSGIPPFIGFIGKELLYEAQMDSGSSAGLVTVMGFVANAINVAVALKVGVSPFRNRGVDVPEINAKARHWSLLAGPLVIAVVGCWMGLFPGFVSDRVISPAVRDIMGEAVDLHLKIWHGFNRVLLLSALTVAAGVLLYACRDRVRHRIGRTLLKVPVRASAAFDAGLARFVRLADRLTRVIQHGNLRLYLAMVLVVMSALVTMGLMGLGWRAMPLSGPVRFVPAVVSLLMAASGIVAIRSRSTVMAVLAMGGVGYGVALLFAFFGAPDLALTQLLVETLTLALLALAIRRLPPMRQDGRSDEGRRMMDLGVAVLAGLAVTMALLAVRGAPAPEALRVSAGMAARSLPEAHGRNVVNVILVDFRALDTMGEICVLAIAGLGVAGLLTGPRRRDRKAERAVATPLYRVAVAWMTPILWCISLLLLLRGHNEPGGGFIGGLVAGSGLALRRLAGDAGARNGARAPLGWMAAGVAVALASTLPSLLAGKPFMQGAWLGSVWLPLVGKTGLGTPFVFDVGVYLVVIGVCQLVFTCLTRGEARMPRREPREET